MIIHLGSLLPTSSTHHCPRVPLFGGRGVDHTIYTRRVVGLSWCSGIVVGLSWCSRIVVGNSPHRDGTRQIPRQVPRQSYYTTTIPLHHDNPTTIPLHHDNPFGCLRNHGGPKVQTFCGSLTSYRSTIYTDPPMLVATPTLNPTNSHHLDAPAASGQTPPPPSSINGYRDRGCSQAVRKSMHTIPHQFAPKWLCHFASVEK
jgi:hypothetical protein